LQLDTQLDIILILKSEQAYSVEKNSEAVEWKKQQNFNISKIPQKEKEKKKKYMYMYIIYHVKITMQK